MSEPTRREQLLVGIATRLRRMCADMPPEHFEPMVHDIARITSRYEGGATPTRYDPHVHEQRAEWPRWERW